MPVSRARYNQLRANYKYVAERCRDAEALAAQRLSTITRMAGDLDRLRDEKPDSPVPYQPATGHARRTQLLDLSERARRRLDADRSALIDANLRLNREVRELREALAAVTAAAERSTA